MKNFLIIIGLTIFSCSCRNTRKMSTAIAPRDTAYNKLNKSYEDSVSMVHATVDDFKKGFIDFRTFSAKVKVDVENDKGKQPDLIAVVKMIKDSSIWISLSATFLNIEVYRILIEKNKVILLNKQDKEVQYRTIDYLTEVTQIPFDFSTVQNLLIGNPVFFTDSISSLKKNETDISILTIGEFFKHLMTISAANKFLQHSKLDDVDINRNRTADISYGDYENINGKNFSNTRHIVISEKSKIDIKMKFKQVEFNKELSVTFNIPRNYKSK